MRLEELQWDEDNERHIARHNVTPEEVEEICFDQGSRIERTKGYAYRRYLVQGITWPGRYLLVVLDYFGRGIARPVTARDMNDAEQTRFKAK